MRGRLRVRLGPARAPWRCACAVVPRMLGGGARRGPGSEWEASPPRPAPPRAPSRPGARSLPFPERGRRRPVSSPCSAESACAPPWQPWRLGSAGTSCGSAPLVKAARGRRGWERGPLPPVGSGRGGGSVAADGGGCGVRRDVPAVAAARDGADAVRSLLPTREDAAVFRSSLILGVSGSLRSADLTDRREGCHPSN